MRTCQTIRRSYESTEDTSSNNSNPRQRAQFTVQKLLDARNFAEAALAAAQQQQEYYANQHREVPKSFQLGDKVWLNLKNIRTLRPSKKLDWIHAKYTITKIFPESPHFYELVTNPLHQQGVRRAGRKTQITGSCSQRR